MGRIMKYARKAYCFGPTQTARVVYSRLSDAWQYYRLKSKAQNRQLHHSWRSLCKQTGYENLFSDFFERLEKKPLFVNNYLRYIENVTAPADKYTHNSIDLLGSGECNFGTSIAWHQDFRLHRQNSTSDSFFPSQKYAKDIIIKAGEGSDLVKDIKLPWELSRFQHVFVLGCAYKDTNDEKYAVSFTKQVSDWLDNNPLLLGPNWLCPMDVALRALNWQWAFYFFRHSKTISQTFWERFVCSMYDHAWYLERNWEVYDSRTSNHYLSDLVGYFYLCYFFKDIPAFSGKAQWCHEEIKREFAKQVFDEGTDYEGSTNYHKLVTELFYHWYLVASELSFTIDSKELEKLHRMFSFIEWCTPHDGTLISIGDNDSGKVLYPSITPLLVAAMQPLQEGTIRTKHYKDFGISLFKSEKLHVSLRNQAYKSIQPSGHFHNDMGSMTLNYKGIDIFVDPGSYVYTPSKMWRNAFRSAALHTTFYIEGEEPIPLDDRLFALDMPEFSQDNTLAESALAMHHTAYNRFGLTAHRSIHIDEQEPSIIINDSWQSKQTHMRNNMRSWWNFTLGATVRPEIKENGNVLCVHNDTVLAKITSDLSFAIVSGFTSPSYGTKVETYCLRASKDITNQSITTKVTLLI